MWSRSMHGIECWAQVCDGIMIACIILAFTTEQRMCTTYFNSLENSALVNSGVYTSSCHLLYIVASGSSCMSIDPRVCQEQWKTHAKSQICPFYIWTRVPRTKKSVIKANFFWLGQYFCTATLASDTTSVPTRLSNCCWICFIKSWIFCDSSMLISCKLYDKDKSVKMHPVKCNSQRGNSLAWKELAESYLWTGVPEVAQ